MKVIKRGEIPIYEIECSTCGSLIRYSAAEVEGEEFPCPVCTRPVWTVIARKVGYCDDSNLEATDATQ